MRKRIQQVLTSLKERTCVSYAKIATIGGFCDIDHTIVKATSPDDLPLPEKYVNEFLKIFAISHSSYRAFALSFTRRFGKTKSWRVALKCLLLLHRLLRSLPNDSLLRAELLWARTNRMLSLSPCDFRDTSSPSSEDFTSFIRSYATLLDEALHCNISTYEVIDEDYQIVANNEENSPPKMEDLGRMIEILPQVQILIDRAMDCWPSGAASRSFLIQSTMKHIIRDSFSSYTTLWREIMIVLENLIQLPYGSCVAAFGIYKKAAIQADQLFEFHEQCKYMGYCGSYEYPVIDRIPYVQIQALENFLDGMWQFTDNSSSSPNVATQMSSDAQSLSSFTTEGNSERCVGRGMEYEDGVEKEMEMEPLIQWEAERTSVGWEDLLEASINASYSCMASRSDLLHEQRWLMQVHNPYFLEASNPFCQKPDATNFHNGSCPTTQMQLSSH